MTVSTTIQIRNKGSLTLPVELPRKDGLSEGDVLTLDRGEGVFITRVTEIVTLILYRPARPTVSL
jgi:hypothetical protein